jgi:hypothetical protein
MRAAGVKLSGRVILDPKQKPSVALRRVKPDPISLDISPANGGMSGNQGGWDESEAPEGEARGQ